MREGWRILALKEVCDDYRQDIVDGPFGANLKREHYTDRGVPVLKIQNIKPFKIVLKKMDYVTKDKAKELRRHGFRRGDIILTKLGLPLGVSAIVEDMEAGIIVADLVRVRAAKIDTKYLCYHLNSPVTSAFLNKQQGGTTRPRVRITAVRELPIAVPPLPEQKRIVAILDEAFAGIAAAVANAERNLANARELFESHLNAVFTQKGEGWVEKKLYADNRFIDYRGKTPKKTDSGLRLITAKNVRMGFLQREPEEFVAPESYESWMTRGIPQIGDVLFTTEAPLGLVCQLDTTERVVLAQRIITFQPDRKSIDPTFLKWALMSSVVQSRIHANATGATARGIKASRLKEIMVPRPSIGEQSLISKEIESLLFETQRLESVYKRKLDALAELKQSILHKAFSGELTSRDVEAQQ